MAANKWNFVGVSGVGYLAKLRAGVDQVLRKDARTYAEQDCWNDDAGLGGVAAAG